MSYDLCNPRIVGWLRSEKWSIFAAALELLVAASPTVITGREEGEANKVTTDLT